MAGGREFTAKYGANVTGFKSGMEAMVAELDKYNSALVKNQQQQRASNKIISEAQKELGRLEKEAKAGGGATEEQKKKIEELNAKIEGETKLLAQLKTEQIGLKNAISDTTKQMSEQDGAAKKNTDAMDKYKDSMKNAGQAGKELATEVAAVGAAAVGVTAGIYSFVKAGAQWADDLNTLGKTTGIATAELQKFEYASKLIDVSSETITGSLTKLTRNMQSARDGSGAAAQAFETLGVSVTDASGNLRDRQEVFYEVIDALGKVGNETEMDALAMNIFGKSAQQLNPLIKGGAERLKELGSEAENLGLILDQKTLDNLNDFNDKVDTLGAKGEQITKILASQAQPAVEGLVKVGDELLKEIKELADSGELEKTAKEVGALIEAGARALKNLLVWIGQNKEMIVGFTAALVGFKLALSIGTLVSNLVIGLKALKTAQDSATVSQAALNTVLNANPYGIVIGLVGALATGLTTYAMMAQNSAKATGELNSETENYLATVEQARQAAAEREEQTEADISSLNVLKDRYDDLRSSVKLTAAEKSELDKIAGELAKTLGKSNDDLKEKDGVYKDLTGDIDEYIKTLKEQMVLEANKEELTAAYKSYNSALKAAADTREKIVQQEAKLIELEEEFGKKMEVAVGSEDENLQKGLRDTYYPLIEKEREKLKKLNNTWAEYYVQGSNAASIIKETSEAMGSGNKATEEWESQLAALNGTTVSLSESQKILAQSTTSTGTAADDTGEYSGKVGELAQKFGELADSAETAEDRLTEANKELVENQLAISQARQEMKEAEKKLNDWNKDGTDAKELYDTYINKYEAAKDRIASLQTEQVKLRMNIADIKEEIKAAGETADDVIGNALGQIESTISLLDKAEKEIKDTGALSLSTLNNIIKKYPDLTDAVDKYMRGVSSVGTVIDGLKKHYDNDVANYNSAVGLKKLAAEDFTGAMGKASAELVNKYKEDYGIDLRNFTTAAAAKAAVQENLDKALAESRAKRQRLIEDYAPGVDFYGNEYVTYRGQNYKRGTSVYSQYEALRNEVNAGINSAFSARKNFDPDDFVKTLASDLMTAYGQNSISAAGFTTGGSTSTSTGSTKTTTGAGAGTSAGGKTEKYSMWGVYGEGSTALAARLNWLDNALGRGRIGRDTALGKLRDWQSLGGLTAAEREQLKQQIYRYSQKTGSGGDKVYKMNSWGVYGEGSTPLAARLSWLDRGDTLGRFSDSTQIRLLKKWRDEMKLTQNEKYELDRRILQKQKEIDSESEKSAEEKHSAEMKRLELAKAAYEKFYNERRDQIEALSEREKKQADAEIAALEEQDKARQRQKEDADIEKRLKEVSDQLQYGQNDEFTIRQLRRQRQEIINEKAEIGYQRELEAKKLEIQQKAEAAVEKNTAALENLAAAFESAAYLFARAGGNLTPEQIVNNSSSTTNYNYMREGLSLTDYKTLIGTLV